jgi:hypothetical protein
VTKYAFSNMSLEWLKEMSFKDDEIDALTEALNMVEHHKRKGESGMKLPSEASPKVSALMALLESITDADGRPICFEESGLISIPEEAVQYFEEDLELEELERVTVKLKKVKFARRYSDPRRRGTMKGNEKFGSF